MGLLTFALIGFGTFLPLALVGIVALSNHQYNRENAAFREGGDVLEARVVDKRRSQGERDGFPRRFLEIEWGSSVLQTAEVLVDEDQYLQAPIGERVPVWTLADGRARLVSRDAVIPWFLWLLLVLVPTSLVGLFHIFRTAIRSRPDDAVQQSSSMFEAARIGRRAARSAGFGRSQEEDAREH